MSENTTVSDTTDHEGWIDAGDYSFKLDGDVIVARNAKGRVLKTVPAKAKKLAEFERLDGLRVFLAQHEQQCLDFVRRSFLTGLPVPLSLIIGVWADPSWRKFLADVVVTNGGTTGFLRAVDDEGVQIVDLDGESISIDYSDEAVVKLPHPAVMEDLEDWREFAVELGVHQGLDQLFRDVHIKPADKDSQKKAVESYRGGKYDRYVQLFGRGRGGGFLVTNGEVSIKVSENGETVTATLGVDSWGGRESAELESLSFSKDGQTLALENVGPIAWSEGIRMCEFIYAGRTVKKEEEN